MSISTVNTRQIGIIILTIITALIHLFLGITSLGEGFFGVIFILNGLGYLALMAALYLVPQLAGLRPYIRWAFIIYTAVTIILYFAFNWPDVWGPAGITAKIVEIILVVLLWLDRGADVRASSV